MSAFTVFFCVMPWIVIALPFILALIYAPQQYADRKRKLAHAAAQNRLREMKIIEAQLKAAALEQLREMREAEINNKVVLQDSKIELEQLRILALRRKLSLDAPDFKAKDYD